MSKAVKIGLLGGPRGHACDIPAGAKPSRLVDVHVYSDGNVINALKFSYMDECGKQRSVGPWGTASGQHPELVELADDEYIQEISGTYGRHHHVAQCIKSLKFVTSEGKEYEYGQATGEAFRIPVAQEGKIVAFFGRSADLLDALGVYVLP